MGLVWGRTGCRSTAIANNSHWQNFDAVGEGIPQRNSSVKVALCCVLAVPPSSTVIPIALTVLAKSPSNSLITAEKLLLVKSRNSQQRLIDGLSHPELGCSFSAAISRLCSWYSQN
jgi:hypothetical protein